MDLRTLIEAADTGTQFPPLKVMAGGAFCIGYVGTKAQRESALKDALSEHFFEQGNPKRRGVAEEVYARATAHGTRLAETMGAEGSTEALALLNCQVWPPGGDGIEARIVYLPVGAVDSWWIGSQTEVKRRSGGFFAGILVPIDGESTLSRKHGVGGRTRYPVSSQPGTVEAKARSRLEGGGDADLRDVDQLDR